MSLRLMVCSVIRNAGLDTYRGVYGEVFGCRYVWRAFRNYHLKQPVFSASLPPSFPSQSFYQLSSLSLSLSHTHTRALIPLIPSLRFVRLLENPLPYQARRLLPKRVFKPLTMAQQSAATPASLLVTYQVKKEHGYLLGIVKQLETHNRDYDVRLKSVETTTAARESTNQLVKDLDKRVNALVEDSKDREEYFNQLIDGTNANHDKATDMWRRTQDRVSTLDEQYRDMQADATTTSSTLILTAKNIEAIEETLSQLHDSVTVITQSKDTTNGVDALKQRLDALELRRGNEVKCLQTKVDNLERISESHAIKNSELQSEVACLKAIVENQEQMIPSREATTMEPSPLPACIQVPSNVHPKVNGNG
ncbi:hypothetical protein K504DRAFT_43799 [Pleomassaria siparia CBS 279.74]|uniref:Uncharacterized protein n=1 Tax=Pleomassaria siparia CBS 279.74 TaxID=1314801 RepID=A0A6G1K4Q3_9PLEO|nr:hypothetical protein K504DRAFT_43799 [Pleomassaria siparia CBS 279.74]